MADQTIYIRPYIQYQASTAILCRAGSDLGATLTGHHDFQLADDVIHKVHVGHYTFYSVSVVKNDKLLQKAQGVFCRGYLGGESTSADDVITCAFTGAVGTGPMTLGSFQTLHSTMMVPNADQRAEFDTKLNVLRVQGAAAPELANYSLVDQMLKNVTSREGGSDSLFSDIESHDDDERLSGLLLVKGTHVTADHVYVNPLGLGPVTYSGSSRSRIGKGDPLDQKRTLDELNQLRISL